MHLKPGGGAHATLSLDLTSCLHSPHFAHLRQDNIKKLDASLAQQRTFGSDLSREKSRLQTEADSLRERMEALQGERDTFATQAEDLREGAGSIATL